MPSYFFSESPRGAACCNVRSFGAIKQLQARTGKSRAECKQALVDHDEDEDAAAAALGEVAKEVGAPACAAAECGGAEASSSNATVSIINIEVGDGETFPAYGDTLSVMYKGKLDDGMIFDESRKPFEFKVGHGKVIKGWDEAFMKMSLGEKALLHVPASKAYGEQGNGPVPPNADLAFEVHLLKITRQTSCLGPGAHGGVQRKNHEYAQLADQLLGRAPRQDLDLKLPDEREPMPLTKDMPR